MRSWRKTEKKADKDRETEEGSEVKTRQRMSEGCSLASKHCSKLFAQYGPEGTPPLLTQT